MDNKDWNYVRAHSVQSMLYSVSDNLVRIVHKGSPSKGVIDRMAQILRACADEVEKMRHD